MEKENYTPATMQVVMMSKDILAQDTLMESLGVTGESGGNTGSDVPELDDFD